MEWKVEDNQLVKTFILSSFSEIVNALPAIGKEADAMDHHPDFKVYGYKNIQFTLFTHSENQVTDLDYQLAKKIDEILTSS